MPPRSNISGQTPEVLATVLTRAFGTTVEPGMIARDIEAGAPANPDGSVNLLSYVAWLIKQDGSART